MFSQYLSVHIYLILSDLKKFAFEPLVNFDRGKSETGSTQDFYCHFIVISAHQCTVGLLMCGLGHWGRTCRRLRDDGLPPRAPDFFMKLM